jgi:hypothetical protein
LFKLDAPIPKERSDDMAPIEIAEVKTRIFTEGRGMSSTPPSGPNAASNFHPMAADPRSGGAVGGDGYEGHRRDLVFADDGRAYIDVTTF